MIIEKVVINKFGCHKGLTLDFTEGVNLLVGENESGKSTVLAFIRAMLYGLEGRAQDNPRKKYLPWDASPEERFGGELYFTQDDFKYKAVAVFTQSKRTDITTLYNDVTGAIIAIPDGKTIGEYILGLTAAAYDCTVFAKQLESKADFKKDKDGFLTAKLSAVSNNTASSSSKFAEKNLADAISKLDNRREDGLLNRAIVKRDLLKNALEHYEEREERAGLLTAEMDALNSEEAEKEDLCAYYQKFEEVKKAYATIDYCNLVSRKHKEIKRLENELHDLENPLEEIELDLPQKRSKLITFLAVLLTLLFGAGIFFSTLFVLKHASLLIMLSAFAASAISLFLAILCIRKSKRTVQPQIDRSDDLERIEQIQHLIEESQDELIEMMGGITADEYEEKYKEANNFIASADFDENTINEIKQCPSDIIREKLDEAKEALNEIKNKKSYTSARIDSIEENTGISSIDNITEGADIYTALQNTEKEIAFYQNKKRVLANCREILSKSIDELQNTFGPMINTKTEENLRKISGKYFGNIKISSDFDMTVFDGSLSGSHSYSDYSGATVDQMYLALRFTLAEVMAPKSATLPLYLDDPFVQYDDGRFKSSLEFIKAYSERTNTQIIIASCQSRTIGALDSCNTIELGENR